MDDTGHHYLLDIVLKNSEILKSESSLRSIFTSILNRTEFTILGSIFHKFDSGGEGVTGVYLLSESHLSFHTYPENSYISIDLYTCGRDCLLAVKEIEKELGKTTRLLVRYVERGSCVSKYSIEKGVNIETFN
ncbi:S-adenosylmethionine decarboxylase [Pectobacterium betavasculorum]|uniref:S-adenosylmethionine decarboxylase n=1 Tax=Pectobacterium betavasculorum TaxID=55207 RepID=A0A093UFA5_9GAMM|nr:adenosylmethionine decarboxylase [Pectobacterium betavasculorum]KFX06928.1 S-adenosylmethionine decarboxylase [Pectobacterium betavasculorum]KFX21208.1 S-adenosylmethionine decarboxylase [Pectobacterium betavasculorum]